MFLFFYIFSSLSVPKYLFKERPPLFAARATEPAVGCRSSSRCLGGMCVLTVLVVPTSLRSPLPSQALLQEVSSQHPDSILAFASFSEILLLPCFVHLHEAQARIAFEQQRENRHAVRAAVPSKEAGLAQEGWRLQHLVPAHPQ